MAAETLSFEDEGEICQFKKTYAPKLNTVKEMFPDWTDEDIVFALQETDGDLQATIERISEGGVFSVIQYFSHAFNGSTLTSLLRQYLPVGRG